MPRTTRLSPFLALTVAAVMVSACSSSATPGPRQGPVVNVPAPAQSAAPTTGQQQSNRRVPAASAAPDPGQQQGGKAGTAGPAGTVGTTGLPLPEDQYAQATPAATSAAAAPGGVTYVDPGINPYVSPLHDRQSTFGLDVDTASYTIARQYVDAGSLPDSASIRVEEWINSFDQAYQAPETGAFAIIADGGPAPFLTGAETPSEVLLRVGIKARDVSRGARPSAALTFVIDTSGSMGDSGKLELVKQSLNLLVDQLRSDDSVAIVAFSTEARVVLGPTRGSDRETLHAAIGQLEPQNTTNAEAGLRLGYGLAREQLREGFINRVVLASDGVANVGSTDSESILADVHHDAAAGIQLVAVGVGMGDYNDALLEQLADQGDGFYAYINTIDEARRIFVEDLVTTLDTVALDAKAQVEFDPATVREYRLIGYENRAIADQQFRDNSVAAGAIGAGHEVTALYALRLGREVGPSDRLATVSLRWTDPTTKRAVEIARDVIHGDMASSFRATDAHFKLDALVAAAAEVLRGSPWIEGYGIRDLARAANGIRDELPASEQTSEFLSMIARAARLEE